MRKLLAVAVISLNLLPVVAFAQAISAARGGAPLPIVGVGLPGLAIVGGAYLLRRKRTDSGK